MDLKKMNFVLGTILLLMLLGFVSLEALNFFYPEWSVDLKKWVLEELKKSFMPK